MKKKLNLILILWIVGLTAYSQTIKINPEIQIDSTIIKATQYGYDDYYFSSFDNKKIDSLNVSFASIGTSVSSINIDFTNEPKVTVFLYSDTPDFDGKHTKNVELECYTLEINAIEFKFGDRIYGRIIGVTESISNDPEYFEKSKIHFNGEFSHIVGKFILKKRPEDEYKIMDKY